MLPFTELLERIAHFLRDQPHVRKWVLIAAGTFTGFILAAFLFVHFGPSYFLKGWGSRLDPIFAGALVLCGTPLFAALMSYLPAQLDTELGPIRAEREKLQESVDKSDGSDVFKTIQLSLNQLNEYYTINKNQAKRSFQMSVSAVFLGLMTVACGVWLFYFSTDRPGLAALTSITGIFLQFIGGANFYMYRKSLDQLNIFYQQLIQTQNTMLAIELGNQLSGEKKELVKEKIIDRLLTFSIVTTQASPESEIPLSGNGSRVDSAAATSGRTRRRANQPNGLGAVTN